MLSENVLFERAEKKGKIWLGMLEAFSEISAYNEVDNNEALLEGDSEFGSDGPLNTDSLDEVEFVMALEEKFDIEISDMDMENVVNLGQIVALVEKKLQ